MYIDSLTITALVIFAIFFGVFVKYCILNICGMPSERSTHDTTDPKES